MGMFNITILAIGKIKEKYWQEAMAEYLKRLKPYARINNEELKAEAFSDATKEKVKEAEGEKILKYLEKFPGSKTVILDERGREMTSPALAGHLEQMENEHLIFVIGGSLGFSKKVLGAYPEKLALSKMTLLHEMTRVMLLEQIYRGIAIIKNKNYHY